MRGKNGLLFACGRIDQRFDMCLDRGYRGGKRGCFAFNAIACLSDGNFRLEQLGRLAKRHATAGDDSRDTEFFTGTDCTLVVSGLRHGRRGYGGPHRSDRRPQQRFQCCQRFFRIGTACPRLDDIAVMDTERHQGNRAASVRATVLNDEADARIERPQLGGHHRRRPRMQAVIEADVKIPAKFPVRRCHQSKIRCSHLLRRRASTNLHQEIAGHHTAVLNASQDGAF